MKVTVLRGVYKIQDPNKLIAKIAENIADGVCTTVVFKCRQAKAVLSKPRYQEFKASNLPCFTPSGRFGQEWGIRKSDGKKIPIPPTKKGILEYNGNVVLDYDDLDDFQLDELVQKVKNCPYTLLSFISPSGDGLKVLVKTSNADHLQHSNAFSTVDNYYKELTGLESDQSNKNVNRLCFMSSDPNAYYNSDSSVFAFQAKLFKEKKATAKAKRTKADQQRILEAIEDNSLDNTVKAMNRVEQRGFSYTEGNRYEYVKQFSIECVKYGVSQKDCQDFVEGNLLSSDQDEKKAFNLIEWAYTNIKEVGIYVTWSIDNEKDSQAKQKKQTTYRPELYQQEKEVDNDFSIPELSRDEREKLDNDIKKKMFYQGKVEETLNEYFDFRINTLKSREEYRPKGKGKFMKMEKMQYNSIVRKLLQRRGIKTTAAALEGIIQSDFSREVHPLKENFKGWGKSLEGDETDYIKQVASLVKTDAPKDLFLNVFKKWLVASVANVFIEGQCTNHKCIILCGEQGTNKTTFFTSLFSSEYVFTGHIDLRNKDSMILLSDTFIVLLDEQFSVLNKDTEWEALKSAITMPRIKARKHYAKNSTLAARIANFCGTANRIEILQDDTGNRRFDPFQLIAPIDINKLRKIDIRKMWGQAYKLFIDGFYYLPSAKEKNQMDKYQQGFKKLANEHYLIMDTYEKYDKKTHSKDELLLLNSTEVWKHLDKSYSLNKDVTIAKIGRAMGFLGFQQKTVIRPEDKKRARYWHLIKA